MRGYQRCGTAVAVPRQDHPTPDLEGEVRIAIASPEDIVAGRQQGRALASALGFSANETTAIVAVISELARNIVSYAGRGELLMGTPAQGRRGLVVVARDSGPGIPNVSQALLDGFSTSGGLGIGLPGARRLMDDFQIISGPGNGTMVIAAKWKS